MWYTVHIYWRRWYDKDTRYGNFKSEFTFLVVQHDSKGLDTTRYGGASLNRVWRNILFHVVQRSSDSRHLLWRWYMRLSRWGNDNRWCPSKSFVPVCPSDVNGFRTSLAVITYTNPTSNFSTNGKYHYNDNDCTATTATTVIASIIAAGQNCVR